MPEHQKTSKAMNNVLWMAQWLLALTFIWAGSMKIFQPEKLPFPWVQENPGLALFAGIVDLFAGVGIVLPSLLRIQPKLTVFAAYGIVLLMAAACVFHISRNETKDIGFNIFMLCVAAFVGWGRQRRVPIASKKNEYV